MELACPIFVGIRSYDNRHLGNIAYNREREYFITEKRYR
jgi:hypothetical protein